MRGLGTFGSGAHFEPGVGQVFNGYFSTRGRLGRSALVDVAQIEVLKGPQGAIIGKNTSLGAINITTHKPTKEFEAKLDTQYSFLASDGFDVEAVVSGPLTDRIRGRAVVNYRDVDGWMENPAGDSVQSAEDLTVRVMLDVDITDNIMAELMYQRSDFDRLGKGRTINGCLTFDPGPPGPPGGNFSVAAAEAIGFNCNGVSETTIAQDIARETPTGAPFDTKEPFTLENDFYGLTLTADFENLTVTSLSGYFEYEITDRFDGDQNNSLSPIGGGFTPSPGERISIQNAEDYDQFYQELRITSNTGLFDGAVDYILGGMYFSGEMNIFQAFHSVAGAIGRPTGPALSRNEFAGSETESIAGFAQVDWHVNDRFTITLGGRVTDEDREGFKFQTAGEVYTSILDPSLCALFATSVPLAQCIPLLTGSISETNISYNASISYHMTDDHMFYFTNSTGFKSGGFDLRGAGDPGKFVFPKESTEHFEIGGKHTFVDGSLRFNWAAFHTNVQDLQTSANDPLIISQIVAPANITSQGFEWDIQWVPVDNLLLTFTGTYAEAEYNRFFGACYLGQFETGTGCFNVVFPGGGAGQGVQDQAGQQAAFAPEWSFVIGGDYTWPVGNMELTASAKWLYLDSFFTAVEHDPLSFQDSSNRIDASLVLSGNLARGNPWTLGLIGKNLTDEFIMSFSNSSTLSSQATVNSSIQQTRFIALRGTIAW
jgi:outer membrane receptor protein involved in Fe transport